MKILTLYFSGTGNTHFIAKKIDERLRENSFETELAAVENFSVFNLDKYDLLIFGFPIFACDMPSFLDEYIEKLSSSKTTGVILFSTMGYFGGNALRRAMQKFVKKGFSPLGAEEFKLPGSDGLVIMKKDSKIVKKTMATNYNTSEIINSSINNIVKIVEKISVEVMDKTNSVIPKMKIGGLFIDWFLILMMKPFEKILSRKVWVDDKCVSCGLCEKICPAGNITIEKSKIQFGNKCYFCLKCVHQCPTEAIQIGKITVGKFRWKGPLGDFKPGNKEDS
ncbi:MAG: EFR1 family ferrodoxin [Halanaerobiales bacterium]|nr:EFR1 family ferrodoxin [Halanaerobiales bacterium]